MGILDWVKGRLPKSERPREDVPERVLEPSLKTEPTIEHETLTSLKAQYSSRHGTARALRYWHRHLSHSARSRKRRRRSIVRVSRRENR